MEVLELSTMKKINWAIRLLFPKSLDLNIDQIQTLTQERSRLIERKLRRMEAHLNGDEELFLKTKKDSEK